MSVSRRLVFGCFWIVSSWASNAFRYWICWGDGTGIRFGSFCCCLLPCWLPCCFCWANDCSWRPIRTTAKLCRGTRSRNGGRRHVVDDLLVTHFVDGRVCQIVDRHIEPDNLGAATEIDDRIDRSDSNRIDTGLRGHPFRDRLWSGCRRTFSVSTASMVPGRSR